MDPNLRVHQLQPTATHFIISREGGKERETKTGKSPPLMFGSISAGKSLGIRHWAETAVTVSLVILNPHPMSAEPRIGNDRTWPELPVGCWSLKVHLSTLACTAQRIIKIAK
jgi:hypothetical protein